MRDKCNLLVFEFHMARLANGQEVLQIVRFLMRLKECITDDVVNSQVLSFLLCCFAAYAARMTITLTGTFTLLFPRWSSSQLPIRMSAINIPVMPGWILLVIALEALAYSLSLILCEWTPSGRHSSSLLFQYDLALARTCLSHLGITALDIKGFPTNKTHKGNFHCLTGFRAMLSTLCTCSSDFKAFAAVFTRLLYASSMSKTTTSRRAIALIRNGNSQIEHHATIFTCLWSASCLCLDITSLRAIATFLFRETGFKEFPTLLTDFLYTCKHTFAIALMRTIVLILSIVRYFKRSMAMVTNLGDTRFLLHTSSIS